VSTTRRRLDEANRRADQFLRAAGAEIRNARRALGLSQEAAGAPVRMSRAKAARVEAGSPETTAADLVRLGWVVGLDISIRAYPGDRGVRDGAQLRLLEALRQRLGGALRFPTEVPLPASGDQRAWDGVILGAGEPIAVEAETRIVDAQALERRIALKQRDADVDRVILLVADTASNRQAVAAARTSLAERFPLDTRAILAALAGGKDPGGSGIVFVRPVKRR